MRVWCMPSLVALVLVLASVTTTTAQSPPPEESLTRSVEIPRAGAVVVVPREWRTWQNEAWDAARREGAGVWTTDVDTGWTCHLWSSEDLTSAEAAADALVEAPEAADIGISRGEPFATLVGSAVLVTFGSPQALQPPAYVQHEAYVDAPLSVVRIWCDAAPADHVREVVRTIAPLAPDYIPEPFDSRVEMVERRFAVDLGPEWSVGLNFPGSLLGGTTVLRAQVRGRSGTGQSCHVEDVSAVPRFQGLTTADDWRKAFIKAADGRRGRELTTRVVKLPSGPAVRAAWDTYLAGEPTTAWVLSDSDRVIVLMCHSKRQPKDRWRSIARNVEFLPAEE